MQDRSRLPLRGLLLTSALMALVLFVAACGGRQPAAPPTPTLVATLPVEIATVEPTVAPTVEPTAEPTTAPTAEPTVESSVEMTATAPMTATETVTETAEVTATEDITATEDMTATEELTPTAAMTATADITATEDVTVTESMTATEPMTATEAMTHAEAITHTEAITHDEAMTPMGVSFLQPTDNAVLPITSTVVVNTTGIALDEQANVYLLVDTDFTPADEEISEDDQHILAGAEPTELVLSPGSHVLRLQVADGNHLALAGDEYRAQITVGVVDGAPAQSVRFAGPTNGAIVPPTFDVIMAATGLSIVPTGVGGENSGHLQLLIDSDFAEPHTMIPVDDMHIHFGGAELTHTLTLTPGEHVLRLQFADTMHMALAGDQYRDTITVTVAADAPATQVMFTEPADGAVVESPFRVAWAAAGLIIEPAGQSIRPEGGHLHLLVNEDFAPPGVVIPADDTHIHFGKGQTSTELSLEPGEYTLRLQMANGAHMAQDGPQYEDEMTVTVK